MFKISYKHLLVSIVTVLLLATTIGSLLYASNVTSAQDKYPDTNLKDLLTDAYQRYLDGKIGRISIQFDKPLFENSGHFWTLPYSSDEDDIDRDIGIIGSDFICFYERGGSSYVTRCTPFSNIISVGWLEG